jgi:hypothetical protein
MPERIQRQRTKGWKKPAGAIVVSRPSGWGNPFKVGELFRFVDADGELVMGVVTSRAAAVELFCRYLAACPDIQSKARAELAGKDLCCWCSPDEPCHGDVLLKLANEETADAH